LPRLCQFKGRKIGCLLDDHDNNQHLHSENLLPRYLFSHEVLCQRIYPSEQYGYVDENHLFFWPVALSQFDAIVWMKSEGEVSLAMRTECRLAPLRQFVRGGGQLFLGGQARCYLPYLLEDSAIASARMGVQHLALFGEPSLAVGISDHCCELARVDIHGATMQAESWNVRHEPHGYRTQARYADGVTLQVAVCFADHDTIALEWRLKNGADREAEVNLVCRGDMTMPDAAAATATCTIAGNVVQCDLSERFGSPVLLAIGESGAARWHWQAGGQGYSSRMAVRLGKRARESGAMLLSAIMAQPPAQSLAQSVPNERFNGAGAAASHWQRAELRWKQRFEACAQLAGSDTQRRKLLQRAAATLAANTWRAPSEWAVGNYGGRRVLQVQRSYYPGWYPYEAGLYASGVRNFDAPLARDLLELFVPVQAADGWVPLGIFNRDLAEFNGLSQIPSLAYGAWRIYLADPNTGFLERVYEGLCANINWWYANRRPTKSGVFGFAHGQEGGGDDHPRADEPGGALRSGMNRYRSADASGFVLMEMQCLTRMAEVLRRPRDAEEWHAKIAALDRSLIDELYDGETNFFSDREIETQAWHRCSTPWNLAPLWAGVSLNPELAKEMVRDKLAGALSGDVPFPMIARDETAYLRDVYWRGPSWPQVWLMCLQVLWWYGFEREADAAADALLDMCEASPYLMEIYDSRSGEGLSLPEYSMVAALLFEIVPRRYRDSPPWRGN
jgi:hypothetical protein